MSQTTCERIPAAKAAHSAARAIIAGVRAERISACTAIAAASPGTSLRGRAAVSQKSGQAAVSDRRQTGGDRVVSAAIELVEKPEQGEQRQRPGKDAEQAEGANFRTDHAGAPLSRRRCRPDSPGGCG